MIQLETSHNDGNFIAIIDILLHLMKNNTIETRNYFITLLERVAEYDFKNVYTGWDRPIPRSNYAFHPHPRVLCPVSGSGVFTISDKGKIHDITLESGDILFLVKGGWVLRTPENNTELVSLVFFDDFLRIVKNKFYHDQVMDKLWYHTSGRISKTAFFVLRALEEVSYNKNSSKMDILLLKSLLLQIAQELSTAVTHKSHQSWLTYQRIAEYMHTNFQAPINRSSVAGDLKINESHISKLFKLHSKESFNTMLKRLRMEKAVRMLKDHRYSVSEVGKECGFDSADYFIKAFKKYFGTTPARFRQRR
jgi:AraC-like DNA-binding protein